jgi:8-oxo-dGTP pyrophosphatase MutT (NUDIX family)
MQSEAIATAAGVLIWRGSARAPEFLLLRNARHATWGFAKGHLEPDEDLLEGALRECREETGLHLTAADLDPAFADVALHRTPRGNLKRVVMFLATTASTPDGFRLSHEHDEHGWLPADQALRQLAHEAQRRTLVRAAVRLGAPPS